MIDKYLLYYYSSESDNFYFLPEGTNRHKDIPCRFPFKKEGGKGRVYFESQSSIDFISFCWYRSVKELGDLIKKMLECFLLEHGYRLAESCILEVMMMTDSSRPYKCDVDAFKNHGLKALRRIQCK